MNEQIDFDELFGQTEKDERPIDYQSFQLAPRTAKIFGENVPFALLLRPDNHIGLISERISADELKRYPFIKVFDND